MCQNIHSNAMSIYKRKRWNAIAFLCQSKCSNKCAVCTAMTDKWRPTSHTHNNNNANNANNNDSKQRHRIYCSIAILQTKTKQKTLEITTFPTYQNVQNLYGKIIWLAKNRIRMHCTHTHTVIPPGRPPDICVFASPKNNNTIEIKRNVYFVYLSFVCIFFYLRRCSLPLRSMCVRISSTTNKYCILSVLSTQTGLKIHRPNTQLN